MYKKTFIIAAGLMMTIGLIAKIAVATDLIQVQAYVVPFHWKINGDSYAANDSTDNSQHPTSVNYQGTTYVSIRTLAQSLGYQITWDDAAKTAILINSGNPDDPTADLPQTAPPTANEPYMIHSAALKASAVPLLQDPMTNAKVLRLLAKDTPIYVISEAANPWLLVKAGGQTGYISAESSDYILEAKRPSWEQQADGIIADGVNYWGTPYQFGASSKQTNTFDCSSFTKFIYGLHAIKLPRDSRQQSQIGTSIPLDQLRKGDLIFFTTGQRKNNSGVDRIGHVAVYIGNQKILHTFRVGIGVTITDLDSNWKSRIVDIRRIVNG